MIATDTAIKARRLARLARAHLVNNAPYGLAALHAEQLIEAVEELASQIDELNRLLFRAECELHYADEATPQERLP